jgi:hypothetical protein
MVWFLWTRFGSHKRRRIYWRAEWLLAFHGPKSSYCLLTSSRCLRVKCSRCLGIDSRSRTLKSSRSLASRRSYVNNMPRPIVQGQATFRLVWRLYIHYHVLLARALSDINLRQWLVRRTFCSYSHLFSSERDLLHRCGFMYTLQALKRVETRRPIW